MIAIRIGAIIIEAVLIAILVKLINKMRKRGKEYAED